MTQPQPEPRFHARQLVTTSAGWVGLIGDVGGWWAGGTYAYDVHPQPQDGSPGSPMGQQFAERELAPGDGTGPYAVWGRNGQQFSETFPSAGVAFRAMTEARPELRQVMAQVGAHVAPADWPHGYCPGCGTQRTDRNQATGEYVTACPVCGDTAKPVDRDTIEALIEDGLPHWAYGPIDLLSAYVVDVDDQDGLQLARVEWYPDRPGQVRVQHTPGIGTQQFTAHQARRYAAALEQAAVRADLATNRPTLR